MSQFCTNPLQLLNMGFETQPSRQVYLVRQPRKIRQQHDVKIEEQVSPKDNFHVTLDVHLFKHEEVSVKAADKSTIVVEAKHEDKENTHGAVYRHFVRKYVVGEDYDLENIDSRLSTDGLLSITAPLITNEGQKCRVIPVVQTGKLAKPEVNAGERIVNVVLE